MHGGIADVRALGRAALARPEGRYLVTGATVALVYIGLTLLLSAVAGLPMPVSVAVAYFIAVVVHFTMQRRFVFGHVESFALAVHHQIGRYIVVGGAQYLVMLGATEVLAPRVGVSGQVAFLVCAALLALLGFLTLREGVFHPHPEPAARKP
jgi:putative flippase GtrA